MTQLQIAGDPIGSPHPLPWHWVLNTHDEVSSTEGSGLRYYRSADVVSPDGKYAAYTQIEMHVEPELHYSQVRSRLYVENCRTGDVQPILATSPMTASGRAAFQKSQMQGTIAISLPLSWSRQGDRLLTRQFEGLFCGGGGSDYAVVWDCRLNRTTTLSPNHMEYSYAVLLGWSQAYANRILFRVGSLGRTQWSVCAVGLNGETVPGHGDRPLLFGNPLSTMLASSRLAASF